MTYLDDYMLTLNSDFLYKLQQAMASVALDVQSEATNVTNHALRSAFAIKVLANLSGYSRQMASAVVTDGTITIDSTDAQIKTRVSAVWNAFCVQS